MELNLKKSLEVCPPLYPILEDAEGKIIDGFHRRKVKKDWPTRKLEWVKTKKDRLVARIHANEQRRTVDFDERRKSYAELAELLKNEGMKTDDIQREIAKLTGFSDRWVREFLPPKFKREYKPRSPKLEVTSKLEVELPTQQVKNLKQFGKLDKVLPKVIEKGTFAMQREAERKGKTKEPEIAPEPEFTGDDWTCPKCGAVYLMFHVSPTEHKFDRVKGEIPAVEGLGSQKQTVKKSRMFYLGRDRPIKTWTPVGGCKHHCYGDGCWAARLAPKIPRYKDGFDHPKLFEHELKKRFRGDVIVFVSPMGDLFGVWVPDEWILKVIEAMKKSDPRVTFFLETKNPARYAKFLHLLPPNTIISTTIETNRDYRVSGAPSVRDRLEAFKKLAWPHKHVSIEPIMDFDLEVLVEWMREINPEMISIGYDNYHNHLPEPPLNKTMMLINQLERFTKVERKTLREKDASS